MTIQLNDAMPSRIPIARKDRVNHYRNLTAPTRLEKLKIQLQARIARDIQLASLQYEQDRRANDRRKNYTRRHGAPIQQAPSSSKGGGIRAFFETRRTASGSVPDDAARHYRMLNRGNVKRSVGVDRAHPLQPLKQNDGAAGSKLLQNESRSNSFNGLPNKKETGLAGTRTYSGGSTRNPKRQFHVADNQQHKLKPKPPDISHTNAEPIMQTVTNTSSRSNKTDEIPSRFQTWQAERDQERNDRLERYHGEQHPHDEMHTQEPTADAFEIDHDSAPDVEVEIMSTRDFNEEIRQREKQLMLLLDNEKAELNHMQQKNKQQEDDERKQNEREMARRARQARLRKVRDRRLSVESRHDNPPDSEMYQPTPPPEPPTGTRQRKPSLHTKPDLPKAVPFVPDEKNVDPLYLEDDPESQAVALKTGRCTNCGRSFALERLDRHQKVCSKTTNKKRKVFNLNKMRTRGTDLEHFQRDVNNSTAPKANNWRQKHESFQKTLEYVKMVKRVEAEGGDVRTLPPPPPSMDDPSQKQCPHCKRTFNAPAAERHIPRCKDLKTKPARRR